MRKANLRRRLETDKVIDKNIGWKTNMLETMETSLQCIETCCVLDKGQQNIKHHDRNKRRFSPYKETCYPSEHLQKLYLG